jgi:branched-chain amino acid transport system ATP-binding protein
MSATPILELDGVSAGYEQTTVLRDIQLNVQPGSIVALLGPNGAGKTTLLRVASGLLKPRSGTVSIGGEDLTRARPHARARAGLCLVPEGRGIYRDLTVRENLRLLTPPWQREADLDGVFAAFPVLEERLDQVAGSMSGGQQQMLALSRAWLARPQVVLLDEVSMGLAPRVVDEIFTALRQLAATGVALLLVEQYVDRALAMADHVHLLSRGSTSYSGPASGIDRDAVMRGYLGTDAVSEPLTIASSSADGSRPGHA